jgi:hypothetical protein
LPRWYLIVVLRAARCASQVLDRGALTVARGAAQVIEEHFLKSKKHKQQRSSLSLMTHTAEARPCCLSLAWEVFLTSLASRGVSGGHIKGYMCMF